MASDPLSLPDPFGPDPFQGSSGDDPAQSSPMNSSPTDLPDPSTPDIFQPSPSPIADDGTVPSQKGIWFNDQDAQFLLQWSLEEVREPQLASPTASQAAPPTAYKARVRIFQEIFETTLGVARPVVPFSLRDAIDPYPYLQGSLVLLQQPSGPPPVLLVKNLKFSGFQQAQVVLYPSAPEVLGGESGALGGVGTPGGSGDENGG